jgi:hypothetical protein
LQSAQILDLLELSRPDNLDDASKDATNQVALLWRLVVDAQDGTNPHFITFASFRTVITDDYRLPVTVRCCSASEK